MRSALIVVALLGCGNKQPQRSQCDFITEATVDAAIAQWAKEHQVALGPLKLHATVVAACRRDRWTDVAGETQRLLETILPTHIGAKATTDGGLAEAGPHPDYPTPLAAGTSNIFFLEDPVRGPVAPKRPNLPPRGSLTWETHAYCDTNKTVFACSAAASGTGNASWRVGRKGNEIAVLEERFGDRVVATTMYTRTADGTPLERLSVDGRGRVVSALFFRDGRMSGRVRNGGNVLDGCGYFAVRLQPKASELQCLQWTGEPMLDMSGVATFRAKRDDKGFLTEEANFGTDGKAIVDATGKHLYRYERDAFGRVVVDRFFDLDGKRAANPEGCSGERSEYDTDGLVSRVTCLDDGDHPRGRSNGVAIRELVYDGRGCNIGTRYLDKAGKPTMDPDGIAGEDLQVDRYCTQTRRTCVDLNGDAHACGPGRPAQYRTKLDGRGFAVSVTHFNEREERSIDEEFDAFELRYRYDDVGNVISLSCFDSDGESIECDGTGFHEKRTAYDANGRRTQETFVGRDGKPAHNLGASSRRFKHDNYDHPFESQSFDETNHLVEQSGTATIRELYDIRHQRFALVLLDMTGKPARYTACFTGATCPERARHAVRIVRLGDGSVEYNQFFDENGQLIEAVNCRTNKCFD